MCSDQYLLGCTIYNLYLHPLAKYPGPLVWRATRLGFVNSLVRGNLVQDVQKIHEKYGDIVRLAPNELSFAREEAWRDVFAVRPGHKPFLKNQVFWKPPPGSPQVFASTADTVKHARQRKLMDKAFTEGALNSQEPAVQSYVDLLMAKLRDSAAADPVIDIVNWYNFYTFDVIGDLAFGEPFDCLKDNRYHPWVSMIFNFIKGMTLAMAARYFPILEFLLKLLIPKRIKAMQQSHQQMTIEKVHRRLNLEKQRNDFMTPIVETNQDFSIMSLPEVESTGGLLIVTGSETTATTLSGTTNCLIQNPQQLEKLVAEVRGAFKEEKDITFASTKDLPYLNSVINEGLRLCNPVPAGLPRVAPEGGGTVCGHFIPEWTHISVHPTTLYQSPANFFHPKSFSPERWLPAGIRPKEFDNDRREVLQPFGLGPRNCIGQKMAWSSMRLVLARMVWNFDLQVVEGRRCDWTKLKTFIIVQKEPVWVRLTEREKRQG